MDIHNMNIQCIIGVRIQPRSRPRSTAITLTGWDDDSSDDEDGDL